MWLREDKLKGKTGHFRLPSASQKRACLSSLIGTLRATTATPTKPSPQNITLHCRELLAVRPSPSRRTMWAKYPKNKLVRAVSE